MKLVFQSQSKLKYKDPSYFKVPIQFFDEKKGVPKRTFPKYKNYTLRYKELEQIKDNVLYDNQFRKNLSVEDLRDIFIQCLMHKNGVDESNEIYFIDFGNKHIKELEESGDYGNGINYFNGIARRQRYYPTNYQVKEK